MWRQTTAPTAGWGKQAIFGFKRQYLENGGGLSIDTNVDDLG